MDYFLNTGDVLQLGADRIFCGNEKPKPPFECAESCQYFDSFKKVCLYKIKCEFTETCLKKTKCEFWDDFKKKCLSEDSEIYCKGLATTCTEKCTHFDAFKNVCRYKTSCAVAAGCYVKTYCEKWDDFKNSCLSEAKKVTCAEAEY